MMPDEPEPEMAPEEERRWRWARRVLTWFAVIVILAFLYLASPLALFAALRAGILDPDWEGVLRFLQVFYAPAEWLSNEWDLYEEYIDWSMEVTGAPI